jgi:hypothetical protein
MSVEWRELEKQCMCLLVVCVLGKKCLIRVAWCSATNHSICHSSLRQKQLQCPEANKPSVRACLFPQNIPNKP